MKKSIVIMLVLGSIFSTNAQFLNFGVKGGLNYNSNGDLQNDLQNITISSDSDTGYHFGAFAEIKLPLFLYVRPELTYTKTQSNYDLDGGITSGLTIKKIDAPVLVGIRVLKIGRIFLGPSFQYILDTELSNSAIFDNVKEISSDDFSVGVQFGFGIELGKFGVDARWEQGLSDTEANFIGSVFDDIITTVNVDTRPQQFILSVYYKFK